MTKYFFTLACCMLSGGIFSQFGWTKITSTLNPIVTMSAPGTYKGAAWIDVDNDDDVDLFASPNFLFINQGGGVFSQSSQTFLTPLQSFAGCSFADIDADGDNDLVIAENPSAVFLNDGLGNFSQINSQFTNFSSYPSWACAIGNATNDKYLEIIFAHAAGFHAGTPQTCRYYTSTTSFAPLQKVNFAFTDTLKPYTVPFWSDFDLDGDMDLFIASGPASGTPNYDVCYKNMKIETGMDSLKRLTAPLFTSQKQDGQCYNFIDYDNDKDLDLCLTNYSSAPTRFYKNNGGVYTTISTPFTNTGNNLSNCWGDYDNDGDMDVIISRDNTSTRLYSNLGNGTFTLLTQNLSVPSSIGGVVNGDFDNDGDLDVFMNGSAGSKGLYRNDTVAGNRKWINIKLTGVNSNISALGAIVRLKATINANPVWQMREVNAQNTFQGQNDLRVHFGLADATVIDSLMVNWPSGLIQTFTILPGNNFYHLTEGTAIVSVTGVKKEDQLANEFKIFPNPTDHNLTIAAFTEGKYDYHLMNSVGEIILVGRAEGNKILDISEFKDGIYFLRINSDTKNYTYKVIKN
ncbi:MAG: VCBS repeat-containing protein [Bacteroidetes bacterium]|nr:VCBS repeat-containing protein [Bacteroidota bacterium]